MKADPDAMPFDPSRRAVALGDDLVFLEKLLGGRGEGLLGLEEARARFAPQLEVPVLGDLLGLREALLLRGAPVLFAADRRRALPEAAAAALEELQLAAARS
jgi:hypothetical protein